MKHPYDDSRFCFEEENKTLNEIFLTLKPDDSRIELTSQPGDPRVHVFCMTQIPFICIVIYYMYTVCRFIKRMWIMLMAT